MEPEAQVKRRRSRGFKRIVGHLISHKFCLVCGSTTKLSVDHIIPRDQGGAKYAPENIMFLCKYCNSHKSNIMPLEWLQTLTPETIRNYSRERFQLLLQVIDIAMNFHCQLMSFSEVS